MKQFHKTEFSSEIGVVQLVCQDGFITELTVVPNTEKTYIYMNEEPACPICKSAVSQLKDYFAGNLQNFDLPLKLDGSDLQLNVWNYLKRIPYGKTVSYSDVAAAIGCKSIRAVATVVGKNPIPIIIPCHRVIRKSGAIGQFSLIGPQVKKYLLQLENEK